MNDNRSSISCDREMTRKHVEVALAAVVAVGLGAALGAVLAGSSSTRTVTRTVASGVSARARTVTQTRTVERIRTTVKTVAARGATQATGGAPTSGQTSLPHGSAKPQQFSGNGSRVLGTITIAPPGATLRWTNSGGSFRLLFDGNSVAVESSARSGQLSAPPLTYQQVAVSSQGHWTIRIG
jgi:hypothetical protein